MKCRLLFLLGVGALLTGCSQMNEPLDAMLGGSTSSEVGAEVGVEIVDVEESNAVSVGSYSEGEEVYTEQLGWKEGEQYGAVQQGSGYLEPESEAVVLSDPPAQRLFFFGFDSSRISEEDLSAIQAHAAYLIEYPVMIVRLEGHTDERGAREYNLSLGERRAQTVSDLLVAEGVQGGQIEIISYGEEEPLEVGHEETFWAQNRRVELSYPQ